MRDNLIQLALDQPTLSPRELAVRSTDIESCPPRRCCAVDRPADAKTAGERRAHCRQRWPTARWKRHCSPRSAPSKVIAVRDQRLWDRNGGL